MSHWKLLSPVLTPTHDLLNGRDVFEMTSRWLSDSSCDAFWVRIYRISKCGSGLAHEGLRGVRGFGSSEKRGKLLKSQTFDFPKGSTPIIDFRYLSISSPSPPSSPFHCAEITSSRSSPAPWLLCLFPTASMARTWNTDLDLLTSNLGWVQEDLCFFVWIYFSPWVCSSVWDPCFLQCDFLEDVQPWN